LLQIFALLLQIFALLFVIITALKSTNHSRVHAVTEVGQDVLEGQNVSIWIVEAKEEQNTVIYHLSRSKNRKDEDFLDGIQEIKAMITMNGKVKLLMKHVTIYIRSITL
jgi:methyl coenzyme M reductase gamma subunit